MLEQKKYDSDFFDSEYYLGKKANYKIKLYVMSG